MVKKKLHKHWIFGRKWSENKLHPISQKHRRIDTRERHDLATGKLQRWAKRKNLVLVDSTFDRYKREVLMGRKR